jgi:hypothetical protein
MLVFVEGVRVGDMEPGRPSSPFIARDREGTSDYATGLYKYANGRLDDHRLRTWMTQRLMLDCGLDHVDAQLVSGTAIEACRKRRGRRATFGFHAPGRPASVARRLTA